MAPSLFSAAEAGEVDKVREVLKESSAIDIETKDHTGSTPLIAAVKNAHIEVVKELLAAGADPLNPSSQGPPSSYTSDPEILSLLAMAVRPPPVHQQYPSFNPHHQPPPPPQFQEMGYPLMEMQQGGGYPGFYPPGMFMPQYGMYPPPPPPHHQQQQMPMHMQPQHEMQQQQLPRQVLPGEEKPGGESEVAGENGAGTIPPPDVSKMIPCKFFPDCRYGASCAFLHPAQPAFTPPPAPPPSAMYPQHYQHGPEHFPHPYYQMPPPFGYNGPGPQMRPPPPHVMSAPQQPPFPFQQRHQPPHHLSLPDYNNENAFIVVPPPFQAPPNFSPSALATPFAPSPSAVVPAAVQASSTPSPPPPAPSPPAQETAAPSDPAIISAVSPTAESAPAPVANEPVVQQQREFTPQQHGSRFGPRVGPFGPGAGGFQKKGWMPGGAKKWLGGSAPPCIYFARNLCRNGNICRFPHIQADGTDCRLPGIIDGSLSAAPVSNMSKPAANRQFANSTESPSSSQPLDASADSLPASEAQDVSVEDKLANLSVADAESTPTGPRSFSSHIPSAASPAFVPAPRANGAPSHLPFHPNSNRAMFPHQQPRSAPPTRPVSPNAALSTSQHFAQVASANQQRSSSANPLRRKEDGTPFGGPQQQQQLSQSAHVVKQRVPSSEDFPALGGGSVGSLRESTGGLGGSAVVVGSGKTAAQVLSGPAPEKAKPAPVGKKVAQQQKKKDEEDARSNSSAEAPTSSDLSSEDDSVLVAAAKSAPSAPNGAPSPPPVVVKKPLSFANAAGALVGAKA